MLLLARPLAPGPTTGRHAGVHVACQAQGAAYTASFSTLRGLAGLMIMIALFGAQLGTVARAALNAHAISIL